MLQNLKSIKGFRILANDSANETIGKVKDVYFDDEKWAVRYLVVDTKAGPLEDLVLISPYSVSGVDWEDGIVWVNSSKKTIEGAPKAKLSGPLSRKYESSFNNYFKLPHYWSNGLGMDIEGIWAGGMFPHKPEENAQSFRPSYDSQLEDEEHIHSMDETLGFHLRAVDDENFGAIEDFLVEPDTWALRYIIIDTHKFLPGGKKILLAPEWVEKFDWENKKLITDYLRHTIESCPEYDPSMALDRMMEEDLHSHFGRTGYWNLRSWPTTSAREGGGAEDHSVKV